MKQEGRSVKEFTREFEKRANNSGKVEEHAKLALVGAVNGDTFVEGGTQLPPGSIPSRPLFPPGSNMVSSGFGDAGNMVLQPGSPLSHGKLK